MFQRFFSPLIVLFGALLVAPSFLLAGTNALPNENEAWLQRSLEIIEQIKKGEADPNSPNGDAIQQAAEVARQTRQKVVDDLRQKAPTIEQEKNNRQKQILFVTLGNPPDPDRVRLLLEALDGENNLVLVLRGLPVGVRRIDQMIKMLSSIDDGLQEPPAVLLDPQLYQKYGVTVAPTLVIEEAGKEILRVAGVTDPDWVRGRLERGQRGDLGVCGDVEPVAERDLMAEIQDRLNGIDWQKKKAESLKNYWANRRWVDLPLAKEDREFRYSPEFEVTEDVITPNGQVIAYKGERIRPLAQVPATFFLVVFDASDKKQVRLAKSLGKQVAGTNKRLKYLATRIEPGEDGWKEKHRLEKDLGEPLYFIDGSQAQGLRLKNIPATVETENGQVVVREYRPTEDSL